MTTNAIAENTLKGADFKVGGGYHGNRSKDWKVFEKSFLAYASGIGLSGGFTVKQVFERKDRGGKDGPGAIGALGSDTRVKDDADHELRDKVAAMKLVAQFPKECSVRLYLEDHPEILASAYATLCYVRQECHLDYSSREKEDMLTEFKSYKMDEEYPVNTLNEESVVTWTGFVTSKWALLPDSVRAKETSQCMLRVMVEGVTDKLGSAKTELLEEPCEVTSCIVDRDRTAVVEDLTADPPIFGSPACTKGEFRETAVKSYLDRKWRAGIKSGQIHVKRETVRYVKDGKSKRKPYKGRGAYKLDKSNGPSPPLAEGEVANLKLRCYNCGGIGHGARVCGTPQKALTRKLLMEIRYPSECVSAGAAWPTSWSDGSTVRKATADESAEEDEQDSDDGAVADEGADDGAESADSEDVPEPEKVRYARENDGTVRYITSGTTSSAYSGAVRVVRKLAGKK